MRAASTLLCSAKVDTLIHALTPLLDNLGSMVTTFHDLRGQQRPISAVNALLTMWLASCQGSGPAELADAYDICLQIAIHGFAPRDVNTRRTFRMLVFHQLSTDITRLPPAWLEEATWQIHKAARDLTDEGPELLRLAREIAPQLFQARS